MAGFVYLFKSSRSFQSNCELGYQGCFFYPQMFEMFDSCVFRCFISLEHVIVVHSFYPQSEDIFKQANCMINLVSL